MRFYLWLKKHVLTARQFVAENKLLISVFSVATLIAIGAVLSAMADMIAVLQAGGLTALLTVPLAGVGFTLIAKQFKPGSSSKSARETTIGVALVTTACIALTPTFIKAARSADIKPEGSSRQTASSATTSSSSKAETKSIRIEFHARTGGRTWSDVVTPLPSTPFQMRATFTNIGSTATNNVHIKVTLPPELQYVSGSSFILNSNNSNGAQIGDDISTFGQNIGHYAPQSGAMLIWSVIPTSSANLPCIPRTFTPLITCTSGSEIIDTELTVKIARPNC